MTAAQFAEWEAFAAIEPFGDQRIDIQTGMLGAIAAKMGGDKNAKPKNFMPDFDRDVRPRKTARQIADAIRGKRATAPKRDRAGS